MRAIQLAEKSREIQEEAIPLRAAIYARHSSSKQNPKSCDEQISHIKYLLGKNEVKSRSHPTRQIEIADNWVIKDEAISGRTIDREGYQVVLDALSKKSRPFDILILDDLSRATRDLGGMLDLYNLGQYSGIEILSVSDNLSSADPNAKMFFSVKGMINDFGNEAHAMRTLRGLEAKVLKGLSCGDLSYGYTSKATQFDREGVGRDFKILINETEAEVIRKIFKLFADGYGRSLISQKLNNEKIPWPGFSSEPVIGKGWNPSSIFRFLHNEKYIGIWNWKKTTYKLNPITGKKVQMKRPEHQWVSHHEGEKCREDLRIVSQTLWNKVQKVFEEIHKNAETHGNWGRYFSSVPLHMLSGTLKCAECGASMILITGQKGGYFGCFDANRRALCSNRRLIRRLKLERIIIGHVMKDLNDETLFVKAATHYNALMNEKMAIGRQSVSGYEQEVATIEIELKNAADVVMRGGESESLLKAIAEREKRKHWLTYQIRQIKNNQEEKVFVTPGAMKEKFQKLTEALQKQPRVAAKALGKVFPDGLKMKWEGTAEGWKITGRSGLAGQSEVQIVCK